MSRVQRSSALKAPRGFTLVELLASIFIIALLIGILLPSVNSARISAKNVKIKAQGKAIGDALENFRSDNEKEFAATNGYPPSNYADDPTETTGNLMVGAMWLPRYLMGKDLKGFVPRRAVPPSLQNPGAPDEQAEWYKLAPTGYDKPLDRAPVYLEADDVEIKVADQIAAGFPLSDFGNKVEAKQQVMIVDVYGRPLLYYLANTLAKPGIHKLARENATEELATYNHEDNAPITGNDSAMLGWDFGAGLTPNGTLHKIKKFGAANGANIGDDPDTFCWYILDKKAFEASKAQVGSGSLDNCTVQASQRSSFLLISAGLDGVFGTPDDITNFER